MSQTHREIFRARAQKLRREATPEERRLWYDFLKGYPHQFKRQSVFGDYIVDFYCPAAGLVVEVDGSQHFDPAGAEYDKKRTAHLEKTYDLKVIRFTDLEVKQNFSGVCQEIDKQVKERSPHQSRCARQLPP